MKNSIIQQHMTSPQKLMAATLGMLLVMQTACMNHNQGLGFDGKKDNRGPKVSNAVSEGFDYEEEAPQEAETGFRLADTARLALQEKSAKKYIDSITLKDPINVLEVPRAKYQWTAIPDSGIGGLQQYTLSLKFEFYNRIPKTLDMEGIKAVYSLPQKEFTQAINLEGLLSSDEPRTFIMDLGTKTRDDWKDWLLSAKGYYHIQLLTRTGDKAIEIAELIGGKSINAVKDKIAILIQEQRVSSGRMALIDTGEILENLNPALLQELTPEQLADLNPIKREDVSELFKQDNVGRFKKFNIFKLFYSRNRK